MVLFWEDEDDLSYGMLFQNIYLIYYKPWYISDIINVM